MPDGWEQIEGVSPPQPGPVKPWHEYHGNEKVHMPKYPVLSRQENHMNDTTRDDIYQFDDAEIAAHPIVQRLINEAVTARDAEIREALLSDKAKNASAHEMQELSAQGVIRNHTLAFYGMKSALAAIGLGDETGGQG